MLDSDNRGMLFAADPHFMGMDRFIMFYGVVEDRDDPIQMGRCRVRIIGTHHPDKEVMPTEDLPWAMPVQPIISAAAFGVGHAPLGPVPGTYVVGYFADGMDRQVPFFFGTIAGGTGQFNSGAGQNDMPDYGTDGSDSGSGQGKDPNTPYSGPVDLPKGSKSQIQRAVNLAVSLKKAFPELPLKDNHVAAVVGNMWVESCGFQYIREGRMKKAPEPPGPRWKPGQPVAGTGYGWAQWSGSRLNNFIDYCAANKLNPMSDQAQWGFLIKELKGDYYYIIKTMASNKKDAFAKGSAKGKTKRGPWDCSTPEGAAGYFMASFENPNPKVAHYDQRCARTKETLYALNKANVPSGSVSNAKK